MSILYGTILTELVAGQVTSTWSPANGAQTTTVYEGTLEEVKVNAKLLQSDGWTTEITQLGKGGVWQLKGTFPEDLVTDNPSLPEPIWTITPTAYQRNLAECSDLPWVALMTTEQVKLVLDAARTKTALDFTQLSSPYSTNQQNSMITLYGYLVMGVESRDEYYCSIKRSLVLPRYQVSDVLLTNNNKVLSKNALISKYTPDTATQVLLPDGDSEVQTNINNLLSTFKGYLEIPPIQTLLPNNRVQIEQAWIYNQWIVSDDGSLDNGYGLYEVVF